MSSTYVRFRDQGFEANDTALEIWLTLLVQEIDAMDQVPEWLGEVRDEWHLQATADFGFGVMPGLDRFVTTEKKRKLILVLARKALKKLEAGGDVFSREELNLLLTGAEDMPFIQDVPAPKLIRPAQYFIKLLEGTLEPWETDSRFDTAP